MHLIWFTDESFDVDIQPRKIDFPTPSTSKKSLYPDLQPVIQTDGSYFPFYSNFEVTHKKRNAPSKFASYSYVIPENTAAPSPFRPVAPTITITEPTPPTLDKKRKLNVLQKVINTYPKPPSTPLQPTETTESSTQKKSKKSSELPELPVLSSPSNSTTPKRRGRVQLASSSKKKVVQKLPV